MKSPIVAGLEDLKVADLFNEATREWHTTISNSLFESKEAYIIQAIPLLGQGGEDQISWGRSSTGQYSVRSAYYRIMEDLIDNNHLGKEGDWMAIWKIKVPQKVKLLPWQAARGVLLVLANLRKRRVTCDSSCPHYTSTEETERYIFFECPKAKEAWTHIELYSELRATMEGSIGF